MNSSRVQNQLSKIGNTTVKAGNKVVRGLATTAQVIVAAPFIPAIVAEALASIGKSEQVMKFIAPPLALLELPKIETRVTDKLAKYNVLSAKNWFKTIAHPLKAHYVEQLIDQLENLNMINEENIKNIFTHIKRAPEIFSIIGYFEKLQCKDKDIVELLLQNGGYSRTLLACINSIYKNDLLHNVKSNVMSPKMKLEQIISLGGASSNLLQKIQAKNGTITEDEFYGMLKSIADSYIQEIPCLSTDPKNIILSYLIFKPKEAKHENVAEVQPGLSL